MPKQKRSFFEKLTGIKKIDEEEQDVEINNGNQSNYQSYEEEDTYEFPDEQSSNEGGYNDNNSFEEEIEENLNYREREMSSSPVSDPAEESIPTRPQERQNEASLVDSEGQLTIDVYQTDDDVVIKSTIAGVKPEDLDVNINNDMVTIRGERKQDEEVDGENYYYQECYWGTFSRSVILPVEIITEKAEATMKNGILTIRLPKADVTKTRKIQVRGF